jgi:hypothetical protein
MFYTNRAGQNVHRQKESEAAEIHISLRIKLARLDLCPVCTGRDHGPGRVTRDNVLLDTVHSIDGINKQNQDKHEYDFESVLCPRDDVGRGYEMEEASAQVEW